MDIIKNFNSLYAYGENGCSLSFEDGVIAVTQRKASYDSLAVKVNELLGENQAYYMSATLKTRNASNAVPIVATFKLTIEYLDLLYTTYDFGVAKNINNDEWQKIENKLEIPPGAKLVSIIAYFVQRGTSTELPDILIKDFTVEKAEAMQTVFSENKRPPIKRQEHTTIGAIRWDAYNVTGTNNSFVSDQVARALSEYPENAPFFADYNDNKIQFPVPDQEQFDTEAKLASDAGLDYFAYCWYADDSQMAYARKQHLLSPYKDKIKMCAIIGVGMLDDETLNNLCLDMSKDVYLKFDGRPVIYLYDAFKFDMSLIQRLEKNMKEVGITAPPYYIGMITQVSPFLINALNQKGIDAIGAYACIQKTVEPFTVHSQSVMDENNEKYLYYKDINIVPLISCGRDSRPRIKNPVSWAGDYSGRYVIQPTFEELYDHCSQVIKKMADEEKNVPNTALIYAWNEHDEGAWCCPTLTMKDGKPLLNNDGSPVMNTLFLDALKKAIRDNKC